MKKIEIIEKFKKATRGMSHGRPCNDERDRIVYGDTESECTGVVTTTFPSIDVITKAGELGANLIISNEATFYSHGDPIDWLEGNSVFEEKKRLLDKNGITIWRCHEYCQSGLKIDGKYIHPINYSILQKTGWLGRMEEGPIEDEEVALWLTLRFEGQTVGELASHLKESLNANGFRIVGDLDQPVYKMFLAPGSILGLDIFDKLIVDSAEKYNYDCILTLDLVEFTVTQYAMDRKCVGKPLSIIQGGHYVMENPCSEFEAEWMPEAIEGLDVAVTAVNPQDPSHYLV